MSTEQAGQVPVVGYLRLDGSEPRIVVSECIECGAWYFDRRNACAACFGDEFRQRDVDRSGTLTTFTIVSSSRPGVPVPYVAGVVDCGGVAVRANVRNVEPTPQHVRVGMRLRLTTYPFGVDEHGVEAVGFGFEPVE